MKDMIKVRKDINKVRKSGKRNKKEVIGYKKRDKTL